MTAFLQPEYNARLLPQSLALDLRIRLPGGGNPSPARLTRHDEESSPEWLCSPLLRIEVDGSTDAWSGEQLFNYLYYKKVRWL